MRTFKIIVVVFFFIISGCKSTASVAEMEQLKSTVASSTFKSTYQTAIPVAFVNVRGITNFLPPGSNQNSINLAMHSSHFNADDENVDLRLPFYGEQQSKVDYSNSGYSGFLFKGKPNKLATKFNKKNNSYTITYWITTENEELKIFVNMFASNKVIVTVNSSIRTSVTYYGTWSVS